VSAACSLTHPRSVFLMADGARVLASTDHPSSDRKSGQNAKINTKINRDRSWLLEPSPNAPRFRRNRQASAESDSASFSGASRRYSQSFLLLASSSRRRLISDLVRSISRIRSVGPRAPTRERTGPAARQRAAHWRYLPQTR